MPGIGSTRLSVRKQGNQQDDGAADDQLGRNTKRARQVLPHSAEPAVVPPPRAQGAHTGCWETPDLCWNHDATCDLSVIRRRRILLCCVWSMQYSGTGGTAAGLGLSMQAELRTDTSIAQPCGCNKQSHNGKFESGNKLDRHSQLTFEREVELQRRRGGHCSRDSDFTEVRDELMLHLKTCIVAAA